MMRDQGRISVVSALALMMGWGVGVIGAAEPSRSEITWPGMTRAGTVLLHNGWSLRPAGWQALLGDFPVVMAVHPSEPVLAVLHAGYGEHEVMTLEAGTGKMIGRVTLTETFAGLAWSRDGARLYVGGASDGVVYRFDHDGGLLFHKARIACHVSEAKEKKKGESCIAGIVVSGDGKTLWVADAFAHVVIRVESLNEIAAAKVTALPIGKDTYPYGLAWDEERNRLYASLWNQAEVAVIDTERESRRTLEGAGAPQRAAPGAGGQGALRRQCQPQHGLGHRHQDGQDGRGDRHGDRARRPLGLHAQFAGAVARRVGAVRR